MVISFLSVSLVPTSSLDPQFFGSLPDFTVFEKILLEVLMLLVSHSETLFHRIIES